MRYLFDTNETLEISPGVIVTDPLPVPKIPELYTDPVPSPEVIRSPVPDPSPAPEPWPFPNPIPDPSPKSPVPVPDPDPNPFPGPITIPEPLPPVPDPLPGIIHEIGAALTVIQDPTPFPPSGLPIPEALLDLPIKGGVVLSGTSGANDNGNEAEGDKTISSPLGGDEIPPSGLPIPEVLKTSVQKALDSIGKIMSTPISVPGIGNVNPPIFLGSLALLYFVFKGK